MDFEIDTATKRAKLAPRRNPYWSRVAGGRGGISLGYRKAQNGAGSWIAKVVIDGKRAEERLGEASDGAAAPGMLSYPEALAAALKWAAWKRAALVETAAASLTAQISIAGAVDAYIRHRITRSPRAGAVTRYRLAKYVQSDKALSGLGLSRLRASHLLDWRARLPRSLAPSTENRILNDLRAALNMACERHRRLLPPFLREEIRAGTKAKPEAGNARRQILSAAEVRRIISAAFIVDEGGDFGRLVLLAAATGARFSQLASMRVQDIQAAQGRALVPAAKKGRSTRAKPPIAVPLAPDVLAMLALAFEGRECNAALLERWAFRRDSEHKWQKDHRRPWGAAFEIEKPWAATVRRAGVPQSTVMYALRHSSIVRALTAGLPVRLVAASHDTSVQMIEAHYAAFIVDASQELARRAALSFAIAAE